MNVKAITVELHRREDSLLVIYRRVILTVSEEMKILSETLQIGGKDIQSKAHEVALRAVASKMHRDRMRVAVANSL